MYETNTNRVLCSQDHIIKLQKSVEIGEESVKIHKISREISEKEGIQMKTALTMFNIYLKEADMIIAHNISFDTNMLSVEAVRNNIDINFEEIGKYCTMRKGTALCQIKKKTKDGREYNKYPKLIELHKQLFNTEPKNLHNAFIDILICLRCYCMMEYKRDIVKECRRIKLLLRK